jgi:hypothetical protein
LAGVPGQGSSGELWSHCVSWADLTVPVETSHGAARLDLGEGWPDRWLVSWKAGQRAESRSVRELVRLPLAGADPIRAFSWRRGQRHRPGLEYLVSTGRHHGFESLEEARTLLALDFAGDLADVVSQPLRLRFGAGGKWRVHTPDFLAVTRSGAWLIDVRPGALIKDQDAESFAAAAELALACGHLARTHQPPASRPGTSPAGPRRPQAARSIRLHLGLRHPGRAPVRTPPGRGRPARTSPQGLGRPPGQHVAQARPPRPDGPLLRTARTPHRPRQSPGRPHRPGRTHHRWPGRG